MAKFITELDAKLLPDGTWRILKPLVYETDVGDIDLVIVPSDFITDFASVPRLPIAYLLTGNTAHAAAVVHDWLYVKPFKVPRATADAIFREACEVTNVPFWRRWIMWGGIRLGGWSGFQRSEK